LCPRCGAVVPAVHGPVHQHVPTAPGCWQIFGQVQADEAHRFGYPPARRLVVDAYMAQHPGDGSGRRDRQSVFVHLAGLCAVLELQLPPSSVINVLRRVLQQRRDFPVLARGDGPGELTVLDLVDVRDLTEYDRRAQAWARSVWQTWEQHHALIRSAVRSAVN